MNCEFVNLAALDCASYDNYVSTHTQGTAYHYSAWLKSVRDAYGHDSTVALLRDQQQLIGVAPLVNFARPFGRPYLCALPYCDVGHLLADSSEAAQQLQAHIIQYAQAKSYPQVLHRAIQHATTLDESWLQGKKVAMKMPLQDSAEKQMASYKSKLRSQIRKAEKNGLTFKGSQGTDLLDDFYTVLAHNMRQLGSPVHKKAWYQAILTHYQARFCMGVVYHEDIPIGAGLILLHPQLCSIPWASTLSEYNQLAPNMMLYGELIGYAAEQGSPVFDFGRSTYNEGTYRFKKQWGAIPYPLDWQDWLATDTSPHAAQQDASALKELAVKVWQQLPVPLTTLVGSRVRGMISL
jgi:FemAB-related protein (PEP-CTERM system-associated)